MKREKEVECKVKLSYHEQDIQKIGDIKLFDKAEHSLFPKTNKCKLPNST